MVFAGDQHSPRKIIYLATFTALLLWSIFSSTDSITSDREASIPYVARHTHTLGQISDKVHARSSSFLNPQEILSYNQNGLPARRVPSQKDLDVQSPHVSTAGPIFPASCMRNSTPANSTKFDTNSYYANSVNSCFNFLDGEGEAAKYWELDDEAARLLQKYQVLPHGIESSMQFMSESLVEILHHNPWRRQCNTRVGGRHADFLPDCDISQPHFVIGAPRFMAAFGREGMYQCSRGACLLQPSNIVNCLHVDAYMGYVNNQNRAYTCANQQLCQQLSAEPWIPWIDQVKYLRSFAFPVDHPNFWTFNSYPPSMFRWQPLPFDQKKDVVYIANTCGGRQRQSRNRMVETLINYNVKVDSYGTCQNNANLMKTPIGRVCNDAIAASKMEIPYFQENGDYLRACVFAHYKFVIVGESTHYYQFVTDQLWASLAVGAVPLYWGPEFVLELVPSPDSIVHVPSLFGTNYAVLAQFLLQIVNDSDGYNELVKWRKEIFPQNFKRVFEKSRALHVCSLCDKLYEEGFTPQYLKSRRCDKQKDLQLGSESSHKTLRRDQRRKHLETLEFSKPTTMQVPPTGVLTGPPSNVTRSLDTRKYLQGPKLYRP